MKILLIILLLVSQIAWGRDHGRKFLRMDKYGYTYWLGARYTYGPTSGSINVTASTTSPGLTTGDTLYIASGTFSNFGAHDLAGDTTTDAGMIHIIMGGTAVITGSYSQPQIYNCSGVKFEGLNFHNWQGSILLYYKDHHIQFHKISTINDPGSFPNATYFMQIGYSDVVCRTAMNFATGLVANTFHNITIDSSTFNGYLNAPVIAQNVDGNYSLLTDLKIYGNLLKNITNNNPSISAGFFTGVALNFDFYENRADSFEASAGAGGVHAEWFLVYGYGRCQRNFGSNAYGSFLRCYGMHYPGFKTGYNLFSDNLVYNNLSYSMCEYNNSFPAGLVAAGMTACDSQVVCYNTFIKSRIASYGGDYNCAVVDVYQENVHAYNNVNIMPGIDRTFNKANQYIAKGVLPGLDTLNNQIWQNWSDAGLADSVTFAETSSSPMIHRAVNKSVQSITSFNGVTRPGVPNNDIGAWQYVSGGSVPSCVSYGTTTSITQTTATLNWTAGTGSPTSYDVVINGVTVGNTSSTFWNATGLTANSTVTWKVIAINGNGPATGCSTTNFNTLPNPPSCTTYLLPANGGTVAGQTTAALTWNAAAGATSYQVWIDGVLVTSVGSTNYNAFGFGAATTHTWYIVPTNSGGAASGCSGGARTFTTAPLVTVQILKIYR